MEAPFILGGGFAGILVASKFGGMVLEQSSRPLRGGLLRSITVNGFTFDSGSHVIFSRSDSVLKQMISLLGENLMEHARESYVLLNGLFVPYPFENGIYVLPPEMRAEVLTTFLDAWIQRSSNWNPGNLREWIYGFFGKWISEKYLIPYNEKIWKRPLDQIDVDWIYIPGRLPIPDWRDIVRSAVGIKTAGYADNLRFFYPKKGGFQSLYDALLERAERRGAKIIWGEKVSSLRKAGNEFLINNRYHAKKVINTIPLPELINAMDAPTEVAKAASELDYNQVVVVGVALNKPAPQHHWVYVPEKDISFHRYAWISNYSPYNAPSGKSSIIAEVTVPKSETVNLEFIKERVLEDFIKLAVFEARDLLFAKAWLYEYGYPVYTHGHRKLREMIFSWLREQGIISVGRWGCWHYWNIDKVYENVLKTVDGIG